MKKIALVIAALAFSIGAEAGQSSCPTHYAGGVAPEFTNQRLASGTKELCSQVFVVMHSGISRTPLWSAEHLLRSNLNDAKEMERENSFHADRRLDGQERAELANYERSGFDRGHMAPSADMPNMDAQNESFALSNMVPQNPNHNRHLWAGIEGAVRNLAKREGELYVITGPIFKGNTVKRVGGRVMVPTNIFKIVYDPKVGGAAYLTDNVATNDYKVVSIAEIEAMTGINFFPTMPAQYKQAKIELPGPKANKDGGYGMPASADGNGAAHGGGHGGEVAKSVLRHLLR